MSSYAEAGVDVAAADHFADSIADRVTATWGDNVIGTFGGFATGLTIPDGYHEPVLMMTTDGVGTKAEIARQLGSFDGIGHDLVAMCVDDLAAQGARPIGFTDYLAVGALDPVRDRSLVESVAAACEVAGCALLGGETAVHPGVMEPTQFDLAGAALGVVERSNMLAADDIEPGDLLVGLASPNLRSNGFSLVRSIFTRSDYDRPLFGSTLGKIILEPSVIYAPTVLAAARALPVRGLVHVTGGGLPGNLPRVLPVGLTVAIDTGAWNPPPIFTLIEEQGRVDRAEMFTTFNMGIGFVMMVPAGTEGESLALAHEHGHTATVMGQVVEGDRLDLA